jgi:hypothetical protein
MSNLAEDLDREPQSWRPEPGDKLIGELVDVDERDGGYGTYPILVIRDDDGAEWSWHVLHAVARGEIGRQQPNIGDRLGVKYVGKVEGRDGQEYHSWKVRVDRPAAKVVDLSAYAHDDGGAPAADSGGVPAPVPAAPERQPMLTDAALPVRRRRAAAVRRRRAVRVDDGHDGPVGYRGRPGRAPLRRARRGRVPAQRQGAADTARL